MAGKKVISANRPALGVFRIAVGYPPLKTSKGVPLLSQNRQFQYFHTKTYIYPMVPAYAASLAKQNGYQVGWFDGIAEEWSYSKWLKELTKFKPHLLMIETKCPVISEHWKIINRLKKTQPDLIIVLVGDHVTYNPKESLENCKADYIIIGGDYDFVLADLCKSIVKRTVLTGGVWGRKGDKRIKLGRFTRQEKDSRGKKFAFWLSGPLKQIHDLDALPFVDRELTRWELYAYSNGNYKYTPATYMYSGRDCWWNRCTFCVWDHTLNPLGSYRRFSPERLFSEIKHVVDNYGVKEIFDDAGTMFIGPPLKKFCRMMIDSGYNKKVVLGCNMRLNALSKDYYELMKEANFRFILYGMESANQLTLDKLDKGLKVYEIEKGVKMAKDAGLEPHVTVMLGYPWENEEMAKNTIALSKSLFNKGYIETMQATIVIPYPGTPLYKECVEKDWLSVKPTDYKAFDMRSPVMKVPFPESRLHELTQELYASFFTPKYIFRKITSLRSYVDFKFMVYSAWKIFGHLLDFDKNQKKASLSSVSFWLGAGKRMITHWFPKKEDKDIKKNIMTLENSAMLEKQKIKIE